MKTQQKNLNTHFVKEETQNFSTSEKVLHQQSFIKTVFSSADLWNIQRSRKTGVTYRKHL